MAHTFDTSAQLAAQTGTSITLSYTPGAGSTVLVLGLALTTTAARTGGAPTFAGIAMTQAGTTQATGAGVAATELWYLINPPTGAAANIVVPNNAALNITLVAATYKAAPGLTSVLDAAVGAVNAGSASTNPTLSITPTVSGCAVVSIVMAGGGTLTAGQTLLFTGSVSTDRYGGQYALPAAGAINMNWTNATSTRWAMNAASFRETSKSGALLLGVGS